MGPLFVLFTWMIIGLIVIAANGVLHVLAKRSPVALQLKQVMPAFVGAIVVTLAVLVLLNFFRIVFSE